MHRFFVEPSQIQKDEIEIRGGDVNHIRNVLRMRTGDELLVSDGYGNEYQCRIRVCAEDMICTDILKRRRIESELSCRITLFQCLPKGDKMELIIQKAVELGAAGIVPVASKRCVVRLDAKKEANKRKRWQAVAEGAAKQSGRALIPPVFPVKNFREALDLAGELDVCLIPYECAEEFLKDDPGSAMEQTKEILRGIRPGQSVGIFIGPEGGFEREEAEQAAEKGVKPISLGKRILRTETAGLCILSVLMFWLEE